MINSFSLQEIQKASNLDAKLIYRQYKLNLMADYMRINYENPKLKQSQLANQLGHSSSTLQRNRNDLNMLSPYRITPNNTNKRTKKASNTDFDNNSHTNNNVKRRQMTSIDLKLTSNNEPSRDKKKLKGGANIEINAHNLDAIFHKNNS